MTELQGLWPSRVPQLHLAMRRVLAGWPGVSYGGSLSLRLLTPTLQQLSLRGRDNRPGSKRYFLSGS